MRGAAGLLKGLVGKVGGLAAGVEAAHTAVDGICPGGESWNGLTDRALQALAPILAQGKDTVIVAHGGVIGGLMYRWFPGMPHRFVWTPDPGHGYQITFEDGKPVSYCTIPEHGTLGPDPDTKIPLGD